MKETKTISKEAKKEAEHSLQLGTIGAGVWKNQTKDGRVFRTITLSKGYKETPEGEWKNTRCQLNVGDVSRAIECLKSMKMFLLNQELKDLEVEQ